MNGRSRTRRAAVALAALLAACAGLEFAYRSCFFVLNGWRAHRAESGLFMLYTIGESTPAGEPYRDLSLPLLVERMFGGRIKGRPVRVVNLAHSGHSIYPQAYQWEKTARARNRKNPGVVFIYSGHNDAGADNERPSFFQLLKERLLYRSAALADLLYLAEKASWIPRERSLHTYEFHMRRAIENALRSGVTPFLSTVTSNVADIDPGLSDRTLPPPEKIREILEAGERLEKTAGDRAAIVYYSGRSAEFPKLKNYLGYRIGKCHQRLKEYAKARDHLKACLNAAARDNFRRATDAQNALLRRLAGEYGIPLIDAVELFEKRSPHGLTGDELFADGHHPNIKGHLLLAEGFAEKTSQFLGEPVRRRFGSPDELFAELRYDEHRQADAFVSSGRWLFSSGVRHRYPGPRLDKAERSFRAALALEPDNFYARLGLGFVAAGRLGDFLLDQKNFDRMLPRKLAYGTAFSLTDADVSDALSMLREAGVPETQLQDILQARAKTLSR